MSDPEKSPRELLGLAAADDGDVRGVQQFVSFVNTELRSLAIYTEFPQPIAALLAQLHRETDRASEFLLGFIAGRGT